MDRYILIQFYKPEKSIGWEIYYHQFPTRQEAIDNLYTENNTTHQSCYAKIINVETQEEVWSSFWETEGGHLKNYFMKISRDKKIKVEWSDIMNDLKM
jgi:hypothetical protein